MKRLLIAGVLAAGLGAVCRADDARFLVFQGYMPTGVGVESGKNAPQAPIVIKVDSQTGDSWRLVVSNGYWWVPIKNGVIPSKKAPEAEAEPAAEPAAQ